jgi:hypothetical protein
LGQLRVSVRGVKLESPRQRRIIPASQRIGEVAMGTEIHLVGILLAAVAGFMVGGVWYSALFGKAWMAARGVSKEDIEARGGAPVSLFAITFVLDLFMAFVLDHVFGTYGGPPMVPSLLIAGGIAVGFVIPAMAVNYLYQQAKRNLYLIDGGHWFFAFLAMGAVLAVTNGLP